MTVTIQEGIDASKLREVIYQLTRAGMEADAAAAKKRHAERIALIQKQPGADRMPRLADQGSLFE
jgi:hypothetical protein